MIGKIILQGGGGHARVVLDCLLRSGADVVAVFDPTYTGELMGVPQKGQYDPSFESEALCIVAIGDNALRKKVVGLTRHKFAKAIDKSTLYSPFSEIGAGSMLLHGSIVQAQARIGVHVVVNTGAQVDHDCVIGDYVHIGPGAVLCGAVTVGEGTLIGAGATIIPGRRIGEWVTIGAGAVVAQDLPDFAVATGCPAKVIRYSCTS